MEKTKQFSKYGSVAAGSAATDYAIFLALLFFGTNVLLAQMVSRISGGIFSFFTNKYWSFGAKEANNLKTEGRRFLILYGFSYLLSLALIYLFTEQFGSGPYAAKITADIICFIVNFLVMRRYVFGGGRGLRFAVQRLFNGGRESR